MPASVVNRLLDDRVAEIEAAEARGKRLDFLLQEMNREVNTIGSKSRDAKLAHAVVEMKAAVSRMREQAPGFAHVAFAGTRVLDLGAGEFHEEPELAEHRADAAHLEHQPLDHARAAFDVGRHELAGLLGEIDHDRAGLEDGEVVRIVIDDRGDAAVRIDREVPGLFLLVL